VHGCTARRIGQPLAKPWALSPILMRRAQMRCRHQLGLLETAVAVRRTPLAVWRQMNARAAADPCARLPRSRDTCLVRHRFTHRPKQSERRHPNNLCARAARCQLLWRGIVTDGSTKFQKSVCSEGRTTQSCEQSRVQIGRPRRRGPTTGFPDHFGARGPIASCPTKPETKSAFSRRSNGVDRAGSLIYSTCHASTPQPASCPVGGGRGRNRLATGVRAGPGSRPAGSFPASVHSATADTTGNPAAWHEAPDQGRGCRQGGSGTTAPGSSNRRPTAQIVRSPRRHNPNTSADVGNACRSAVKTYTGRA
jgi:hypothetical protein